MSLAARLFIFINEVAFIIFTFVAPVAYVGFLLSEGRFPFEGNDAAIFIAQLIAYWFVIISLFGSIALMIENNKSLKNIEKLLEKPNLKKEPPTILNDGSNSPLRPEPRLTAE